MSSSWKVLDQREVFAIPRRLSVVVETVELPDGRQIDDYMQIHLADFVLIFAQTESAEIICLRLYRHGARCVGLEFPAGQMDRGETPLDAARRELLEETGYESSDWEMLGSIFQSTAHRAGMGRVFRARNAVRTHEPSSEDLETARVELLTGAELVSAMRSGEIVSAPCLAALALAFI